MSSIDLSEGVCRWGHFVRFVTVILMTTTLSAEIPVTVSNMVWVKMIEGQELEQPSDLAGGSTYQDILSPLMIKEISPAFHIPDKQQSLRAESLRRIYTVSYSGEVDPELAASHLSRHPAVELAEPKYIHTLHEIPNDPYYSGQIQYGIIGGTLAWNIVKGDSGNVIVAVIDGGTKWDHADMVDNVWTNPGEIPNNGIDDDGNSFVDDIHGWNFANNTNNPNGLSSTPWNASHGTKVASIVGARTNNSLGVASMAWNVTFMPMNGGSPAFDRAISWGFESMLYAAHNGARILTNSWGRRGNFSLIEQEVIDYLSDLGCVILSSANNLNTNNDHEHLYPANYGNVMAVGATEQNNLGRASFSGYGASVDVYAPGTNWAVLHDNGGYSANGHSGTSYSTPMTASLAALVMTQHPDWTGKMVAEQVRVTSDNMYTHNSTAYAGLLGKGRINANRAVTETGNPAIRVSGTRFEDCASGACFAVGDTVSLVIEFTNYLEAVSNVGVTLSADYDHISFIDNVGLIPSLNSQESIELSFDVALGPLADVGDWIPFYAGLETTTGDFYSDQDYFALQVDPYHVRDVAAGSIQATITSEGNLGWTEYRGSEGLGYVYNGDDILNEFGLVIGNGVDHVSDCVTGPLSGIQEDDFHPRSPIDRDASLPVFNQEYFVSMDDAQAASPLGIIVQQVTLADSEPYPVLNNGMLLLYDIYNPTDSTIHDLHFGLFSDWDINADGMDYVRYDATRRMGIMQSTSSGTGVYTGLALLNSQAGFSYNTYDIGVELIDGFSDAAKWEGLSGGVQATDRDLVDGAIMVGTGSFDLPPNHIRRFGFMVISVSNLSDLNNTADFALGLYGSAFPEEYSAVETHHLPTEILLEQNYPNPFNPSTLIKYSLKNSAEIELTIFDVNGRQVRNLFNGQRDSGAYQVTWDGEDDHGSFVSTGLYLCKLRSGNTLKTMKMVYLK